MNKASISNKKNSLLLFLIWPFFALYYAISNYKAVWSKNIIWLFVIFYGFTLTIDSGGEVSSDANRYKEKFSNMYNNHIPIEKFTNLLYDEETQSLDVIEITIIYLLSSFTGNFHILFAVFGLVFGFFYSRNIWYLLDRARPKILLFNIPVVLAFAFIVGFWEINGFRFWTAAHIFLYGTLPYIFEGNKKRLLFCLLAVFMHFSFAFPLAILGIYILLGRRTNIYFYIFIATMFVKELNLTQVGDFLSNNLPPIFLPRIKSYTGEEYAQTVAESVKTVNWYITFYQLLFRWAVIAFLTTVFLNGKAFLKQHKNFSNLFSFTLFFSSFANIFSLIPSGGRFIAIANLLSMAFIFFYLQYAQKDILLKRVIITATPIFALFSIVSIRFASDTMNIFSVFGNPLVSMFLEVDISIVDIVKSVF